VSAIATELEGDKLAEKQIVLLAPGALAAHHHSATAAMVAVYVAAT